MRKRDRMQLGKYLLDLREDLYAIVVRVEDSSSWGDVFFRPTDSNLFTKLRLESLYDKYLNMAQSFGIVKVTRHVSCPNPSHIEYITSNEYGLDIPNQDPEYSWHTRQRPDTRVCKCPCSVDNPATRHKVIDELIYPKDKEFPCERVLSIIDELRSAVISSGSGRPRSGVRAHLLMAMMKIDNFLIPGGAANYLKQLRGLFGDNA